MHSYSFRYILFFVFLIFQMSVHGQKNNEIDSLRSLVAQTKIDSVKMINLLRLTRLTIGRDPDQAAQYAKQVIQIGDQNSDDKRVCTAYTFMANIMYIRSKNDSAYYFLDKAYEHAISAKDSSRAFNCLQNKAVILHSNSQLDEALSITNTNMKNFQLMGDSIQMANAILLTGSIYNDKGFSNLALDNFYKALKIYEAKDHKYLMAEAYFQIGSLDIEDANLEKSNDFLHKAIGLYETTGKQHRKAQAMMSLGQNYAQAEDYESAQQEMEASFELSKQLRYQPQVNKVKIFLARIYAHQKQSDKAIKLVKESIDFHHEIEDHFNEIEALFVLADILYGKKSFVEAGKIYKKAAALSEKKSYPVFLISGYSNMSKIAEKSGDYKSALSYLTKLGQLKDSLSLVDQKKQMDELHLIYETEKKEADLKIKESKIAMLTQKVRNENLKKLLYGMAFLVSLISLIFIRYWYSQKLKSKSKEQKQKNLIHQQEMKYKEKELTNQALHLVQKNTLIEKLTERLQYIQDSDADAQVESARLLSSLKLESELNKDWKLFQDYFLQVHSNFDTKLLSLNPKLNENDLRLAYLIKTKLNTQEIASSLHVLPESIRKAKFRLKKKLDIPKEQNLIEFIMQY